ncbi:uncharacterized protein MELLADRAFT_89414 [Melampsora larici-populina 98AG31]|uniref:Uncharacterized protein n=1 Tax=Melampsora larici-populina (strain 98AG31 / pathotype 3-4-7) TaxID=747676 RepID=F4SE83_MELLP|nr:uncharacterized protein MELLADRAFT_89414 [Melampsora larici-populina 98AG31]EGF97042.1 hypothetical protein MELLADRAFT_89414 [Melampsora larici-populina 98AG31]
MVRYQAEKYDVLEAQKSSPIAPRLIAHKQNVLNIQIKCYGKWTPAMRYDIAHRRNVWENRLLDGSMADVGMFNAELAEIAKEDAKHFGDYQYVDNPYAFGNVMQHVSPINGETYPANASWDSNSALIDTQAEMLTGRNLSSVTNLPIHQPIAAAVKNPSSGKVAGNSYKGRNYNPMYDRTLSHHASQWNHPAGSGYNEEFGMTYSNGRGTGWRGGSRGNPSRGSRGGARGGGVRPAIGPGSFDKALGVAGNKGKEKSVASGQSNST